MAQRSTNTTNQGLFVPPPQKMVVKHSPLHIPGDMPPKMTKAELSTNPAEYRALVKGDKDSGLPVTLELAS